MSELGTTAKVGGFVVVLVALFGVALGAGRLFAAEEPGPFRVSVEHDGDALSLTLRRGDQDVEDLDVRHDKELHLIAVRTDFGGYRHLHPTRGADGRWVVPTPRLTPGQWRFFADFAPAGADPVVVHDDLLVAGDPAPAAPSSEALRRSVDGYDIDLAWNPADAGITFTVSRAGVPVTDLERYLGAYGHLVVLGDPGLEFLHVHPEEAPAGPVVPFALGDADPGHYRLYLEFQHGGVVRTVPFSLHVTRSDHAEPDHAEPDQGEESHGDH